MSEAVECPATCCPELGLVQGCTLGERLGDTKYVAQNLFLWENFVFLVLLFVFIYLARWTFQVKVWLGLRGTGLFAFNDGFAKALTTDDNKALSLTFGAYMFAVGLLLNSSLTGLSDQEGKNIGLMVFWQLMGVVLLEIARMINDKFLLRGIDNNTEIVKNHNLGVAAAEAGSYIGTGLTVAASISGEPDKFGDDFAVALMWFVLGQVGFIIYGQLLNTNFYAGFNFIDEIQKGNPAAGALYGLNMIAIGNLIANSIFKSDALLTFGVWYVLGGAVLLLSRFIIDKLIIPSRTLTHEIQNDRNWGAALLVGGIPVALTFVLNTFLPDSCDNLT